MRADIIEIVQNTKMKCLVCACDQSDLFQETVHSKKNGTLRLVSLVGSVGPTLLSLVKEYQESAVKEKKKQEKKEQNGKIIYIGNSLKNSRITPTGEKSPEHALQKKNEAEDDRRHLLSTVATDYPYHVLQKVFHCSSKTVTTA